MSQLKFCPRQRTRVHKNSLCALDRKGYGIFPLLPPPPPIHLLLLGTNICPLSSPPPLTLTPSSQEVDDDEVTNSQAGERAQQRGEGAGVGMPTSRWTIDGEELLRSDIDVRYVCVCMHVDIHMHT